MPGKHVYGKLYRGFESPSLRDYKQKTRVNFVLARVLFLGSTELAPQVSYWDLHGFSVLRHIRETPWDLVGHRRPERWQYGETLLAGYPSQRQCPTAPQVSHWDLHGLSVTNPC